MQDFNDCKGKQERFCDHIKQKILPLIHEEDKRVKMEALLDVFGSCTPESLGIVMSIALGSYRHDLIMHRTPMPLIFTCPEIFDMINAAHPPDAEKLFDYLSYWVDLGTFLTGDDTFTPELPE